MWDSRIYYTGGYIPSVLIIPDLFMTFGLYMSTRRQVDAELGLYHKQHHALIFARHGTHRNMGAYSL